MADRYFTPKNPTVLPLSERFGELVEAYALWEASRRALAASPLSVYLRNENARLEEKLRDRCDLFLVAPATSPTDKHLRHSALRLLSSLDDREPFWRLARRIADERGHLDAH